MRTMVAALLLALAAVACGSNDGMLEAAGIEKEIAEARAETPLPDGQALDIPEPNEGDLYEPGFGYSIVQSQAACLWMRQWVEARAAGDEGAEEEAWRFIEGITDLRFFREAADNAREAIRKRIERAELGDPSEIAAYVQGNCSRSDQ